MLGKHRLMARFVFGHRFMRDRKSGNGKWPVLINSFIIDGRAYITI
jgi:hypothetical protein